MTATHRAAALALLALPFVMAPGKCGFALDFTETILIPDHVEQIVIDADDGSVVATSYARQATLLKRHTFGFEPSVGEVDFTIEDGVLHFVARCKYEGNCRFDHMLELPLGISFEITMKDSQISLGYIGGDIDVTFETGWFRGVRLESPNTRIELGEGDVTLDHATAPETVTVELGEGTVELLVPPGAYQCKFTADNGKVDTSDDITCDDAAEAVLDITVKTGDITVKGAE